MNSSPQYADYVCGKQGPLGMERVSYRSRVLHQHPPAGRPEAVLTGCHHDSGYAPEGNSGVCSLQKGRYQ